MYETVRCDGKVPSFLFFFGCGGCVFFATKINGLNINSDATERQPETPAILQNLTEARKVYMGVMVCKSDDADTYGVIGRPRFLTHLLHIRHAIYTDVRLSYS